MRSEIRICEICHQKEIEKMTPRPITVAEMLAIFEREKQKTLTLKELWDLLHRGTSNWKTNRREVATLCSIYNKETEF